MYQTWSSISLVHILLIQINQSLRLTKEKFDLRHYLPLSSFVKPNFEQNQAKHQGFNFTGTSTGHGVMQSLYDFLYALFWRWPIKCFGGPCKVSVYIAFSCTCISFIRATSIVTNTIYCQSLKKKIMHSEYQMWTLDLVELFGYSNAWISCGFFLIGSLPKCSDMKLYIWNSAK